MQTVILINWERRLQYRLYISNVCSLHHLIRCAAYLKLFVHRVVKFYESGLLQVWVKKWWPQQTFCRGSLVTQARALSLVDMQSSFYVLAIGVAMSAVVIVLEATFNLLTQLIGHPLWPDGRRQAVGATKDGGGEDGKLQNEKPPVTSGLRLRRF